MPNNREGEGFTFRTVVGASQGEGGGPPAHTAALCALCCVSQRQLVQDPEILSAYRRAVHMYSMALIAYGYPSCLDYQPPAWTR